MVYEYQDNALCTTFKLYHLVCQLSARKCNKLLCVLYNIKIGSEDVEWLEADDVDLDGTSEYIPKPDSKTEIRSVRDWVCNKFTIDD